MSDTVADLAQGIRISDPNPARCCSCFTSSGPDIRFVDFNAAIDRGTFVDPNGAMPVLDSIDELHLCELCVKKAAEALALKPERNQRQLREIQRLEIENAHLRDYARSLETSLALKPKGA